ncbi:unnamed protein product [Penicillium camemberti]|uniref:Str. FM013 n=1 Tax=Penicillium camemberti (strain FM 013) TaxID=1429867 RepID=A0A0G4NXW3_PENC3|nr:unnamed protein product [Penicillium camemberti]
MLNLLFLASSEFIEADSSGVTWGVPPPHYVIMNQAATREACMCFSNFEGLFIAATWSYKPLYT